jgi:hypothetical protein
MAIIACCENNEKRKMEEKWKRADRTMCGPFPERGGVNGHPSRTHRSSSFPDTDRVRLTPELLR